MPSKAQGGSLVLKRTNGNSAKNHFISKLSVFALLLGMLQIFAISNPTSSYAAGVGSAYLPAGSYLRSTGPVTLGNGAFTIDVWFKTVSNPATSKFVILGGSGNRGISIYNGTYGGGVFSATKLTVDFETAGDVQFTVPTLTANTWYHLALSRNSSLNWAMWLNGTRTTDGVRAIGWDFISNTYAIGTWTTQFGSSSAQYISNFRMTNTNIYDVNSSTITLPTQEFAKVTGSLILLNTRNDANFKLDSVSNLNWSSTGSPAASAEAPNITVAKITPTFSWASQTKTMGDAPYALTAPTPSTPGTFTYSSATPGVIAIDNANLENATVVASGTSVITATFTPTDADTYSSATTTMTITVNKMLQSAVSITLSPTTKVIKSGFSQVLTTLSGSGGSGTGAFSYTVSTVTAGANCALANNAGTYTLSAATAGTCTLTATRASDASYQSASASTNFTFSTPVRTLSFATTAYSLPYLATQQVTATASAQDGLAPISFPSGASTNTNPKLALGVQAANGGAGNFFGYAASVGAYTNGQTVTFTDQRAGSTVAYTGTLFTQHAGGFGTAFYLNNISQITGTSINSTSTLWSLSGNGAITYSAGVSSACSVGASTGLVSITASTGTCSITASMPEDATYLASSTVTPVAITVGKAAQTPIVLTVSPTSKNGIAPFTQQLVTLSTTGGTGTGVLAYSITDVTAGATCQLTENAGVYTVTAATAGTCSITATKPADTNYLVSADSKTFSFNSNRTLTYAAGLGGGVKSGVTAPTAGPFLTGDTFVIAAGSAYERAGFSFNGWSDGTNTFAAGDNYTVASANITLTAQWRQSSLFGILDADLEEMQSWNASNRTNSGTISNTAGTSSVTVTVPANSLTTGTTVKLWELKNSDFAKSKVDPSKDYIVNLVLSWLKDNGVGQAQTVPTASTPITLSISNNTIKKGAIAYQIIGDVVTQIGTATADGVLNLSITEDPVISIANPIVEAPNNGGGGGGGGGGAPVIVEKTPEVVKPIEVEKPVEVVPVLAKSIQVTHKVFFGMNAAWINSANIKSLKSFIAKISASNQLSQITVEGFTQPTPINPNPLILSKARANSVAKLIRSQGVKAKIVKAGKGDEKVNDSSSRYVLVTVTTSVAG